MSETLHDRFRPFKPYDRTLAILVVILVAASGEASVMPRWLVGGAGVILFWLLDVAQRWVRVPTPPLQSAMLVVANTLVVSLLVSHLQPDHRMAVPLYILNVAFAAVAFGQRLGIFAAVLSVMALGVVDVLGEAAGIRSAMPARPIAEWGLVATVLVTLVALLSRVADLQHQALTDGLTALRNHRYFQVRLREELARAGRYGRPTALAILDLDNFKHVNDRFGHGMGDSVLHRVAVELTKHCRATDVLCRYGGEELAVILPETGLNDAVLLAQRLRQAVEANFREKYGLTVSAGVAVRDAASSGNTVPEGAADLIEAADRALYMAKRSGKNQVCSEAALAGAV